MADIGKVNVLIKINIDNKKATKLIKDLENHFEHKLTKDTIKILEHKPWWRDRHTLLQCLINKIIPNTHLVSSPSDCLSSYKNNLPSNILPLIKLNFSLIINNNNNVMYYSMVNNQSYNNCKKLITIGIVSEWHIGFALSKDRLWRSHSWCKNKNGEIIETTQIHLAYLSHQITFTNKVSLKNSK